MHPTSPPYRRKNNHPRLDRALYGPGGFPNHITIDTARGKPFFSSQPQLAALAVRTLEACASERKLYLHCYCLMPDHLHFVAHVRDGGMDLITFVQYFKSQLRRQSRGSFVGDLWQRSFHDRFLWTQQQLVDACGYVIHNPVEAGLVSLWREYPFTYLAPELH